MSSRDLPLVSGSMTAANSEPVRLMEVSRVNECPVADRVGQRIICIGAGGAGRETDEAADGHRDAADRLWKQLGTDNGRHAGPAERVDGHEDGIVDERKTWAATSRRPRRHLPAAVNLLHRIRRRRVRQWHVTGNQ